VDPALLPVVVGDIDPIVGDKGGAFMVGLGVCLEGTAVREVAADADPEGGKSGGGGDGGAGRGKVAGD
jgi:hypothetical protein